jgi:hypothetical protein
MRPLLPVASMLLGLTANAGCATAAIAPAAFDLHTEDYDRVRGDYLLVDGRTVHVVGTRRHPRVEFDDGTSSPLKALSASEFATPDGCTRLLFEAHSNATVTRLRVTRPRRCMPD